MKILVTGGNGQVGWELRQRNGNAGMDIIALTHSELDIHNHKEVSQALVKYKPDFVVNAAAYTAVDNAEINQAIAYITNRDGPLTLADCCRKGDVPLLHLSTDYVFSGRSGKAYKETSSATPINVYGQSKLDGEVAVRSRLEKHLILRVSGVYGAYGTNFPKSILRMADEQSTLRVVKDQKVCPTPTIDIVNVLLEMIEHVLDSPNKNYWGTYHYCSRKQTNWHEFAKDVVKAGRKFKKLKVTRINPITSNEIRRLAKRPQNSSLNCDKIRKNFGIKQASREDTLEQIIRDILS